GEDGIGDWSVTGVQTCALPISDSPPLIEPPHEEEHDSPAFTGFAAHARTSRSFAERFEGSSWRFPALKISAFQVNVFALLLLFRSEERRVGKECRSRWSQQH